VAVGAHRKRDVAAARGQREDGKGQPHRARRYQSNRALPTGFRGSTRYIHAVYRFVIFVALLACGGKSPEVKPKGGRTTVHAKPGSGSGSGSAAVAIAVAPDIGCLQTSCAFHAGASAYFTCLAGGAGACFHFGGPCAPADHCMYDP